MHIRRDQASQAAAAQPFEATNNSSSSQPSNYPYLVNTQRLSKAHPDISRELGINLMTESDFANLFILHDVSKKPQLNRELNTNKNMSPIQTFSKHYQEYINAFAKSGTASFYLTNTGSRISQEQMLEAARLIQLTSTQNNFKVTQVALEGSINCITEILQSFPTINTLIVNSLDSNIKPQAFINAVMNIAEKNPNFKLVYGRYFNPHMNDAIAALNDMGVTCVQFVETRVPQKIYQRPRGFSDGSNVPSLEQFNGASSPPSVKKRKPSSVSDSATRKKQLIIDKNAAPPVEPASSTLSATNNNCPPAAAASLPRATVSHTITEQSLSEDRWRIFQAIINSVPLSSLQIIKKNLDAHLTGSRLMVDAQLSGNLPSTSDEINQRFVELFNSTALDASANQLQAVKTHIDTQYLQLLEQFYNDHQAMNSTNQATTIEHTVTLDAPELLATSHFSQAANSNLSVEIPAVTRQAYVAQSQLASPLPHHGLDHSAFEYHSRSAPAPHPHLLSWSPLPIQDEHSNIDIDSEYLAHSSAQVAPLLPTSSNHSAQAQLSSLPCGSAANNPFSLFNQLNRAHDYQHDNHFNYEPAGLNHSL
jgi:hypothetical protein